MGPKKRHRATDIGGAGAVGRGFCHPDGSLSDRAVYRHGSVRRSDHRGQRLASSFHQISLSGSRGHTHRRVHGLVVRWPCPGISINRSDVPSHGFLAGSASGMGNPHRHRDTTVAATNRTSSHYRRRSRWAARRGNGQAPTHFYPPFGVVGDSVLRGAVGAIFHGECLATDDVCRTRIR